MDSSAGLHLCKTKTKSEGQSPNEADDSRHPLSSTSTCAELDKFSDSSSESNAHLHDLFTRFEAFNFDDDHNFQAGLSKISTSSLPHSNKMKNHILLKIKAFYYSKHIEPFNFAAYMEWNQKKQTTEPESKTSQRDSQACPESDDYSHPSARTEQQADGSSSQLPYSCTQQASDSSSQEPESSALGLRAGGQLDGSSTVVIKMEEACTCSGASGQLDSECSEALSFAEVAELLQSGKPIPGLAQIEVVPTNEAPTPSQLPRAKKPWEE